MRIDKGYFFKACYSKGLSHHHLSLGRNTKAGSGVRKPPVRPDWWLLACGSCKCTD